MRLNQLQEYLAALVAAGVDPNIPVCIHDEDPVTRPMEVTNGLLLKGEFGEDPAPKMCGFLNTEGSFLLLQTSCDYDHLLNSSHQDYAVLEADVEAPEKSWPNGHWFIEPRRDPGKP